MQQNTLTRGKEVASVVFLCHPHNKSYENPQKACVGAFYIRVRLTLALLHLQTNSVYIWN